jgi:hypothetical protein
MAQDDKLDEVARLVGDRQDLIDVVRLLHAAQPRRPDRGKETAAWTLWSSPEAKPEILRLCRSTVASTRWFGAQSCTGERSGQ